MQAHTKTFFLAGLLALIPFRADADTVHLDDGSLIKGRIVAASEGSLAIETGFAGRVEIDLSRVTGLTTEGRRFVQLETGDRVAGRLVLDDDGRQRLADTAFGTVELAGRQISGIWDVDGEPPARKRLEQSHEEKVARIREGHEKKAEALEADIRELRERRNELEDPWSGSIAFGLEGADGNTDRLGYQGRGELRRTTDFDRLRLYLDFNFQEENGEDTVNEYLAGGSLERDLSDRWFAFGAADFETDEFENLDLRADFSTGFGYFFIREPALTLKGLAGLGYEFESFSDGTTNSEPLGTLGYDVRYDHDDWLHFFHDLKFLAALTNAGENWRVVSNLGSKMPLGDGTDWSLQAKVRNQYDNLPAPGAKKRDTSYGLDLVYDWK